MSQLSLLDEKSWQTRRELKPAQPADEPPVKLHKHWLNPSQADWLYSYCKEALKWQQNSTTMMGKPVLMPRLETIYAKQAMIYRYSGVELYAGPLSSPLKRLFARVEASTKHPFEVVIGNHYRNGNDHIGWHADKDEGMGERPAIASLSLGATRPFQLRRMGKTTEGKPTQIHTIELHHGDLVVMEQGCQQEWLHCLPKRPNITEDRINLTFRPWPEIRDLGNAL